MKTFVVVKAVLVNSRGELLFLRRHEADDNRPGQWDLPGGSVEPGEDFTAAVKRETREEAGIELQAPKLVFATSEIRRHGSGTWLVFLENVANPPITLSPEHTEYTWLPLSEARKVITYHLHLELLQYLSNNRLLTVQKGSL